MVDPNPGYAYPPKQSGYQPAYPPQQSGYQPPPYQAQTGYQPAPQPATHSSNTNVVVVQQPSTVTTTVYTRRYGAGDHGLAYAIIASCVVFWCGGWIGLVCTLPAIFFALNAQQEEHAGNLETMRQHHNWSLILSTVGLVVGFVCLFIWIIASAVSQANAARARSTYN